MVDEIGRQALLETLLAEFASNPDEPGDLRAAAQCHQALPLFRDMGGCYAIRLDGTIVSWSWDEPERIRIESDARVCNVALFQGSKRYPAVKELLPLQPCEAVVCDTCGGTGTVRGLPAAVAGSVVCYCGGLGWVPASTGPN